MMTRDQASVDPTAPAESRKYRSRKQKPYGYLESTPTLSHSNAYLVVIFAEREEYAAFVRQTVTAVRSVRQEGKVARIWHRRKSDAGCHRSQACDQGSRTAPDMAHKFRMCRKKTYPCHLFLGWTRICTTRYST